MITQAAHADPLIVLAVTDPTATPRHRGHEPARCRARHSRMHASPARSASSATRASSCARSGSTTARVPAGEPARRRGGPWPAPDAVGAGPRSDLHGGVQRRHRPRRAGVRGALRHRARRLRQANRRAPGDQAQARRHGDPDRSRPFAHARRRSPHRSWRRRAPMRRWPRCSRRRRRSIARWRRCACSAATGSRSISQSSATTAMLR